MFADDKTERLNISLRKKTIELIDRVWRQGGSKSRSAFLDEAARQYAIRLQRAKLRRRLKAGYRTRAQRDQALTDEWDAPTTRDLGDVSPSEDST